MRSAGGSSIEVYGIPAPGSDPPQLSVLEDSMGVPDRNPIFLPGVQVKCTCHIANAEGLLGL